MDTTGAGGAHHPPHIDLYTRNGFGGPMGTVIRARDVAVSSASIR